jgi:amylosucrase
VYNYQLHQQINQLLAGDEFEIAGRDNAFYARLIANGSSIQALYQALYSQHSQQEKVYLELLGTIKNAYLRRPNSLKEKDASKDEHWFLSNDICGMSLYVDRFCGNLHNLSHKLDYFKKLGINLLHLMPIFQSPAMESDGGYAVSDFRQVDSRFGNLDDLLSLQEKMGKRKMHLMIDIVLNHTSQQHAWAIKAREGDKRFQDYFYMYDNRRMPDEFDRTMPDIFPESSPGNFTYSEECRKWVMTVFHDYQWDLNYTNPNVLVEMLENIFFYANIGVDILRIDAPAFIWKKMGTSSQNLPEAHMILRLIKQCVLVATPGMALLGEAIVAPADIIGYFGTGENRAKECDFAYNATQMALQWDALATADTGIMLAAQHELLKKPFGTSWITYTRCHDDIGLGYDDYMIEQAGFNAFQHRRFLKEYYSGVYKDSPAKGSLFSVNPKTQDARISGSLASLCGLEKALYANKESEMEISIRKIILMQAQSFFIGGLPMLFYGDEAGYTNDYSYLKDPGKSYDNRWMHRPVIDWEKNKRIDIPGTVEHKIFSATQELIRLRKKLPMVADLKNLAWLAPHNIHIAGFLREHNGQKLFCVFNFSHNASFLTWYAFKERGAAAEKLFDHWGKKLHRIGKDYEFLIMEPYSFYLFEPR